jgi:hypothetical protein
MHDRLQSGVDALERVPVPVIWDDIRSRSIGPETVDPAPQLGGPAGRPPPRLLLVAAAVIVICVVGGALVLRASDDTTKIDTVGSSRDDADTEPTSNDGKLFKAAKLCAMAAHEMQVETELAVHFTASNFDPVARQAWEDQASNSDKAIAAMREQLDQIDVDKLDTNTRPAISLIDRTADSPRTARSIVGGEVTDWPAAFEVYSNISGAFVDASSRLANNVSSPELNDLAQSWGMAVRIEADVAWQQAVLTGVFTVGSFPGAEDAGAVPDNGIYEMIVEAVSDEQSHASVLEDLGEPEVVGQMRDAMSGNDVAASDDLRQVALDGQTTTDLSVDVQQWRVASGKKLDRIRDAQMKLADSILVQAGTSPSGDGDGDGPSAGTDDDKLEPVGLFIAVLVLLVAVGLAFLAGRRTARPR